jgi:hypothetical protein
VLSLGADVMDGHVAKPINKSSPLIRNENNSLCFAIPVPVLRAAVVRLGSFAHAEKSADAQRGKVSDM